MSDRFSQLCRVLLSFFAIVLTFFLSQAVFLDEAITTDEHAYVFQAHVFSEGKLARTPPEPSRAFFHEMLIMDERVGWLSRYPPAHSIWLIPGVMLDQPRVMVSLAAGLTVWLLGTTGAVLGLPLLLLPTLAVMSPFFLFMHGTLLSHTSALVFVTAMLWAYSRWRQEERAVFALIAGLAWGCVFLNRTFTGLLIALPFAVDAVACVIGRRRRRILVGAFVFAGTAAIGAGLYLLYNYLTLGDPFLPTYLYYEPSDNLGFGKRHHGPAQVFHTPALGLEYLQENVILLDRWLFGFRGSLVMVLLVSLAAWRQRMTWFCLAAVAVLLLGYTLFWFEGIRDVGPVYYFEALPFFLVPFALGLIKISSAMATAARCRPGQVRALVAGGLGMACLSFLLSEGRILCRQQDALGQLRSLIKQAPANSMIIGGLLPGMNNVSKGFAFNPKGLASDPLLVTREKISPKIPVGIFSERTPWIITAEEGRLELSPYIDRGRLSYRDHVVNLSARTGIDVTTEDGAVFRKGVAGQDQEDWMAFGKHYWVVPGDYHLRVGYACEVGVPVAKVVVDVVSDKGRKVLAEGRVEHCDGPEIVLDFSVDRVMEVEPRVYFGGLGAITVSTLEIEQKVEGNPIVEQAVGQLAQVPAPSAMLP